MKTRKEIGDEYGAKSLYVVEMLIGGTIQKWYSVGVKYISPERKRATFLKQEAYRDYNKEGPKIGIRRFRVALYARVE